MIVVKLLLKIVCIPILAILTLMQLVLSFLSAMTGWMFHLLALIIFVTGGLSLGFGLENHHEVVRMFIFSFICFIFPLIVEKGLLFICKIIKIIEMI